MLFSISLFWAFGFHFEKPWGPNGSQIGHFGLPGPFPKPPKTNLGPFLGISWLVWRASKVDFGSQGSQGVDFGGSGNVPGWILECFGIMFWQAFCCALRFVTLCFSWRSHPKLQVCVSLKTYIGTCWVTPSFEKYILTDFQPYVSGRPAVCA